MIIVNPVRDHLKHKKILLKKISEFIHDNDTHIAVEEANLSGNKDDIYSPIQSDFFSSLKEQSEYLKYFYSDVITPTILTIGRGLKIVPFDYKVHNAWFQQYSESAEHSWHNHSDCQFTNIYYLELPDAGYKTEVVGLDGNLIEYSAKEGDVVTIPSWMIHRSKPNGTEQKTVIAFNTSYSSIKHERHYK
jgi:hypothetical protein|tara:strand:- start:33 stop:602 length:570 start_codon:yes stop_codon:yes gene_type:complete